MSILLNAVVMLAICYPATAIGYLVAAMQSGYSTGRFLYDQHEQAAIKKFVTDEDGR